jgi:hypothetical protein
VCVDDKGKEGVGDYGAAGGGLKRGVNMLRLWVGLMPTQVRGFGSRDHRLVALVGAAATSSWL